MTKYLILGDGNNFLKGAIMVRINTSIKTPSAFKRSVGKQARQVVSALGRKRLLKLPRANTGTSKRLSKIFTQIDPARETAIKVDSFGHSFEMDTQVLSMLAGSTIGASLLCVGIPGAEALSGGVMAVTFLRHPLKYLAQRAFHVFEVAVRHQPQQLMQMLMQGSSNQISDSLKYIRGVLTTEGYEDIRHEFLDEFVSGKYAHGLAGRSTYSYASLVLYDLMTDAQKQMLLNQPVFKNQIFGRHSGGVDRSLLEDVIHIPSPVFFIEKSWMPLQDLSDQVLQNVTEIFSRISFAQDDSIWEAEVSSWKIDKRAIPYAVAGLFQNPTVNNQALMEQLVQSFEVGFLELTDKDYEYSKSRHLLKTLFDKLNELGVPSEFILKLQTKLICAHIESIGSYPFQGGDQKYTWRDRRFPGYSVEEFRYAYNQRFYDLLNSDVVGDLRIESQADFEFVKIQIQGTLAKIFRSVQWREDSEYGSFSERLRGLSELVQILLRLEEALQKSEFKPQTPEQFVFSMALPGLVKDVLVYSAQAHSNFELGLRFIDGLRERLPNPCRNEANRRFDEAYNLEMVLPQLTGEGKAILLHMALSTDWGDLVFNEHNETLYLQWIKDCADEWMDVTMSYYPLTEVAHERLMSLQSRYADNEYLNEMVNKASEVRQQHKK